jgi:NAD+ synthase (glutamine-hydrolysing)
MKLRVALAQINPTVGDLAGNAALIKKYTSEAVSAAADVI